MKTIHHTTIVVLLSILAIASSKGASVDLPKYGFTMDALDTTAPSDTPTQALMSFLPPQDGFSPNVNVVIQPYQGTIKDFISLSKGQFEQMKWAIISEKTISDNEWICEYSGSMQQASLHWYARAILKSGKIYLITATGRESSWKSVADPLKKSVDSFHLK
jgi:hypothetical protein